MIYELQIMSLFLFCFKKEKEEDKGLTLLEVAGALIIIGIVVSLAISQMSSTMSSSDNQRELKNLQTIATKMKQYKFGDNIPAVIISKR